MLQPSKSLATLWMTLKTCLHAPDHIILVEHDAETVLRCDGFTPQEHRGSFAAPSTAGLVRRCQTLQQIGR